MVTSSHLPAKINAHAWINSTDKLINMISPELLSACYFERAVLETAVVSPVHWSSPQITDGCRKIASSAEHFQTELSGAQVGHPLKTKYGEW